MPRPKSNITDGAYVGMRMTKEQKEMFQDIGGAKWLRNYLERQIRSEEIQLGLSPRNSLLENLKESNVKK
jgi:hypothetical protein